MDTPWPQRMRVLFDLVEAEPGIRIENLVEAYLRQTGDRDTWRNRGRAIQKINEMVEAGLLRAAHRDDTRMITMGAER